MKISVIVAVSENNVIGKDNQIPWKLRDDFKQFQETTTGNGNNAVVGGRKTFASIRKPLPNRLNILLTRDEDAGYSEYVVAYSLSHAFLRAYNKGVDECFVIGGAHPYEEGLAVAERLYLTTVHATVEGDTFFPEVDWARWSLVIKSSYPADERNQFPFTISRFEKI